MTSPDKVRESEQSFRLIVDSIPGLVCTMTPGPYLKIHGCVTRTGVQRSLIVVFELWLEDAMETAKWIIAFVGLLGIGAFLADFVV